MLYKSALLCLFFVFWAQPLSAQDDLFSQIAEEQGSEKAFDLLPERMLFTQRLLWGEKGALRVTGIAKLTEEQRMKELRLRKSLLNVHQVIGYVTLAGMVAQGILGGSCTTETTLFTIRIKRWGK